MTNDLPEALSADRAPRPSSWEALAQQARSLADLADRYARMEPAALAPTGDQDERSDPLADLDDRALAIHSVVAACRRATWQALVSCGHTAAEIARMWDTSRQNVSQTLVRPDRPR